MLSLAIIVTAGAVIAQHSAPVPQSGNGTVTIFNAGPSIPSMAVNDTTSWVTSVNVNTETHFYVNVSDTNTIDDIKEVTLDLYRSGFVNANDPTYHYKFRYTETTQNDDTILGIWEQQSPTVGTYLIGGIPPVDVDSENGTYVFRTTFNKTAIAGNWTMFVKIYDSGNNLREKSGTFGIYKYVEMTYSASSGMNFEWNDVVPGSQNVNAPFTVTVTANSIYTLSAAYANNFTNGTVSWEPVLEVSNVLTVPVGNITTDGYTTWFTSTTGAYYSNTGHKMFLDIPDVLPLLSYTGVTIYIQASV